jgi:hypothetical protein
VKQTKIEIRHPLFDGSFNREPIQLSRASGDRSDLPTRFMCVGLSLRIRQLRYTLNSSVCISPPQAIKLGERLSQVLCVLPTEIRLLHPSTSAPYPPLPGGPINHRVLVQDLVVRGNDEATSADDAIRGNSHSVVHARPCRDRVEVAHAR